MAMIIDKILQRRILRLAWEIGEFKFAKISKRPLFEWRRSLILVCWDWFRCVRESFSFKLKYEIDLRKYHSNDIYDEIHVLRLHREYSLIKSPTISKVVFFCGRAAMPIHFVIKKSHVQRYILFTVKSARSADEPNVEALYKAKDQCYHYNFGMIYNKYFEGSMYTPTHMEYFQFPADGKPLFSSFLNKFQSASVPIKFYNLYPKILGGHKITNINNPDLFKRNLRDVKELILSTRHMRVYLNLAYSPKQEVVEFRGSLQPGQQLDRALIAKLSELPSIESLSFTGQQSNAEEFLDELIAFFDSHPTLKSFATGLASQTLDQYLFQHNQTLTELKFHKFSAFTLTPISSDSRIEKLHYIVDMLSPEEAPPDDALVLDSFSVYSNLTTLTIEFSCYFDNAFYKIISQSKTLRHLHLNDWYQANPKSGNYSLDIYDKLLHAIKLNQSLKSFEYCLIEYEHDPDYIENQLAQLRSTLQSNTTLESFVLSLGFFKYNPNLLVRFSTAQISDFTCPNYFTWTSKHSTKKSMSLCCGDKVITLYGCKK